MNQEKVRARSEIVKLIRAWFDQCGFLEVHTPRLVGLPGQEPHLEPFWTEVVISNAKGEGRRAKSDAALITSPEYAMKKLLAEGMDKIYDLGPCFRNNEPWDGTHDPEFLMLEWYRRDAGLNEIMEDTESMIRFVAKESKNVILREVGATKDLPIGISAESFRRITMEAAFCEYLNVNLSSLLEDKQALVDLAISLDQTVGDEDSWDDIFFKIFLTHIEPRLGEQPTFLYRYPASMAALARRSEDDPRYAERVELYIGPFELANGFAELADPDEQRERFAEERELRSKLGKKTWSIDERLLSALPKMGNAAGIAFGVDRLVMLLTGSKSINDILPFSARERFDI
ncbi:EF-P lysine aminoacylase GenX [Patescibacteria group bacterium]|nr:EF-P lysine aminoacylase GenX [Patescibacteria group bacterium]